MTLEQDLRTERVSHLDLSRYISIESGTPVSRVLEEMREQRQNCVFVTDAGRLVGIFTERDVLRKIAQAPHTWSRPIDEFMTPNPETVRPEDSAGRALAIMTAGHYRNVPAVDDQGRPMGNVSHYAIIAFFSDRFPQEIYNLPPEPDQVPLTRAGA